MNAPGHICANLIHEQSLSTVFDCIVPHGAAVLRTSAAVLRIIYFTLCLKFSLLLDFTGLCMERANSLRYASLGGTGDLDRLDPAGRDEVMLFYRKQLEAT